MFSSFNRRAVASRLGRHAVPAKVGVFLQRLRLPGGAPHRRYASARGVGRTNARADGPAVKRPLLNRMDGVPDR